MKNLKEKNILLVKIDHHRRIDSEDVSEITEIKPLSTGELRKIEEDRAILSDYFSTLELGQSVWLNVQDLLETVVNNGMAFLQERTMSPEALSEVGLNYSRLLLNILSLFRSFLDHTDRSISREYGKDSRERKRWKARLAEIYDSDFAYRFFYKMRNYAQHVGVPPLSFSFSASAEKEGVALALDFVRDKLLEERQIWKSDLASELEKLDEKFPVINVLDQWMESFNSARYSALKIKRPRTLKAAKRILRYREKYNVESTCQIDVAEFSPKDNPEDGLNIRMMDFPEVRAYAVANQKEMPNKTLNADASGAD